MIVEPIISKCNVSSADFDANRLNFLMDWIIVRIGLKDSAKIPNTSAFDGVGLGNSTDWKYSIHDEGGGGSEDFKIRGGMNRDGGKEVEEVCLRWNSSISFERL